MSISIKQLQEAAKQIPDRMDAPHIRVLLNSTLYGERCVSTEDFYAAYRGRHPLPEHVCSLEPIRTIDFRRRDLMVDGVKCHGWYYSDILVKVTVL